MGSTQDLTQGPIARQLLALALPLIAGNILQQLYNTIDAMVIGRFLGETAFAAIGVAGTVMNLFLFILTGCCLGSSILFARFYGARDDAGFRREHFASLLVGGCLTLALTLGGWLFLQPLLRLIQTPQAVAQAAASYLTVIFGGLAAAWLYNLFNAMLHAAGNTLAGLAVLGVATLCNLILDLVLIAGLGWGIAGAAWATVLSQGLSALLCFVLLRRSYPQLLCGRAEWRPDRPLLAQTIQYSALSALKFSSLYLGKLLVQGSVNRLGTEAIAAYTAATRVEGFANSFGDSGSSALSVFLSQNLGAQKPERVKRGFGTGFAMMAALGLTLGGLIALAAPAAVGLLLGQASPQALAEGVGYLRWIGIFYVLCYLGCANVGWFQGMGRVMIPVIGTTLHISLRVLLSALWAEQLGLRGVALATGLGWCLVVTFHQACRHWLAGKAAPSPRSAPEAPAQGRA